MAERKPEIGVRWIIRDDLPQVLAIEESSFEFPWSEEEFIRVLRQRNCIGRVLYVGRRIDGYIIYELHKSRLHVLNFAVHPNCRRHGIGKSLIQDLVGRLFVERRSRILLEVRESNLDGQLFFRKQGFKAVSVLRDFYDYTDEAAYVMEFKLKVAPELAKNFAG